MQSGSAINTRNTWCLTSKLDRYNNKQHTVSKLLRLVLDVISLLDIYGPICVHWKIHVFFFDISNLFTNTQILIFDWKMVWLLLFHFKNQGWIWNYVLPHNFNLWLLHIWGCTHFHFPLWVIWFQTWHWILNGSILRL